MLPTANLLETLMLVAFSIGWYLSIAKMLVTRTAQGKSAGFVVLVLIGYAAGASAKLLRAAEGGALDWVVFIYLWNGLVCAVDLALVLRYQRRPASEAGEGVSTVRSSVGS